MSKWIPDRKVWGGGLSAILAWLIRAAAVAFLLASAFIVIVSVLAGCTLDRTDWAGISQAMKERRP